MPTCITMNERSIPSALSNNNMRRMHAWARSVYPDDWPDRCAVVVEYLAHLDEPIVADWIRRGWPELFATAEREWPEAFAGWQQTADRGE